MDSPEKGSASPELIEQIRRAELVIQRLEGTRRPPTPTELSDLAQAWQLLRYGDYPLLEGPPTPQGPEIPE